MFRPVESAENSFLLAKSADASRPVVTAALLQHAADA